MQKKLIALALASAFAAPAAFAATANVDVGGTMNFSVDYLDSDNAINGGNLNVSSNSSNIFFKGSEDLGGGLKAIWQIQTYFSAGKTGNNDTAFGAAADGVSSGNTYVGLSGNFGTVLLGKHEAPAKLIGRSVDLFGDQIGDNRNLVSSAANSGAMPLGATAGFDLRPNNVIAYASPNLSGFSAMVAYVTNVCDVKDVAGLTVNDCSQANNGKYATADNSIDAWSASLKYENGPLMLGLGWQKHNVSEYLSGARDENIWRFAASYKFGDLRLVGLYQKENDLNTGVAGDDRTVWGLGAAYAMGPFTLKGQYYHAGDTADVNNTGAHMWAVGADYSLSKRTTVYAAYATTDNDSSAKYSAFGGGHGDDPGTTGGRTPQGFGIGVKHTF